MKNLRWILLSLACAALAGGGTTADRELPVISAVKAGGGFFPALEAPMNLEAETVADNGGDGFCCAVLGGVCEQRTEFAAGELVWFNSYINDISTGGQIVYDYTLAFKAGDQVVKIFDEPVTYNTKDIPVGDEFTGCTGAPWIVPPELSGRTLQWGLRLVGNGGQVGGPQGTLTGL